MHIMFGSISKRKVKGKPYHLYSWRCWGWEESGGSKGQELHPPFQMKQPNAAELWEWCRWLAGCECSRHLKHDNIILLYTYRYSLIAILDSLTVINNSILLQTKNKLVHGANVKIKISYKLHYEYDRLRNGQQGNRACDINLASIYWYVKNKTLLTWNSFLLK